MKRWMILLVTVAMLGACFQTASASGDKKKTTKEEEKAAPRPPVKKLTKYEKLFKGKAHEMAQGGFMTLHKVDGKLYFEIPLKIMGRDMLLASATTETSDNTIAINGYKPQTPMHICFTLTDSTVHMRRVNARISYDTGNSRLQQVVAQNFINPIIEAYKVLAFSPDSSAVVFDMTALFTGGEASLSPVSEGSYPLTYMSSINRTLCSLGDIKAFEDNVSIKSSLSYNVSAKLLTRMLYDKRPLTIKATRTLLLLPEDRMRPRHSDSRMGVFLTFKQHISNEKDQIQYYTLANRWRLEPKDVEAFKKGELVEPVKPIVFYMDPLFPELWQEPLREGVMRWNQAFEKIGFKNVVQVLDFPKDDPDFDPDNLKYSCIRYVPSAVQNAMGPSWVDPVTGEILNASILIYNDVVKMLTTWRFIQTAQVDPRVRGKRLPDDVLKESLAYVISHEMGHCLGLMHNMAASSAFPVDSLRSAKFTQKYGTTPSIMDYARFNYVAQPGDKGVRLSPPDLGVYDEYVIKWLYSYFPVETPLEEETRVLESWIDAKVGDPMYRFGKQQLASRYDPSALEEDLGDDPIKAGEYGIKNLKYILANLNKWIQDDETAEHRQAIYNQIVSQYSRYLQNVVYCIGGIYLNDAKDGTAAKRYTPVPKAKQKAAVAWVIRQLQDNEWLDNREVCSKFGLHSKASAMLSSSVADLMTRIYMNVTLSSYLADKNPYTMAEFFQDFYSGVWDAAIKNRKLSHGDKVMQKAMMNMMAKSLTFIGGNKIGITGTNGISADIAYAPTIQEICLYGLDESGIILRYAKELSDLEAREGKAYMAEQMRLSGFGYGYGWQSPVTCDAIDESTTYYYDSALKIKSLLEKRIPTANAADKAHYQAMLFTVNQMLGVN